MRNITIDDLNVHLFETIEMLKNNKDKKASENEKIDIDTAKVISDLSKNVVEGFKVKAQVLNILSKADNPNATEQFCQLIGLGGKEPGQLNQ